MYVSRLMLSPFEKRNFSAMRLLKGAHTLLGIIVFTILFAIFFPLLLIPIVFQEQFRLTGVFNRWWARMLFILIGIPFRIEYRFKPDKDRNYIFCPNHFSYLDIPVMGLNHLNAIFVGKSDMEKIPVFGFMYRKLHITVDRSRLRSRYSTMVRTLKALEEGKSLIIFPEGGIVTENPPAMAPFKDGAFRASIEKQIPIVPVTIPFNWIILPEERFLVTWKPIRVIFHEPIDPSGFSMRDIGLYKDHVRRVIQDELNRQLK